MKRILILAVLALAFKLFLGGAPAYAQVTFKIPVKFEVNGEMRPAGDYRFEIKDEGTIALKRLPDGEEILVAVKERLEMPDTPVEEPRIVLDMVANFVPSWTEYITDHILSELWLPGEKGGQAVAEILFGDCNPSGRLPVTFPRHAGQLPVYYNWKPSKSYWIEHGWGKPYVDLNPLPLYAFGHGLSYTTFAYSDLKIEPKTARAGATIRVSASVTNTGNRPGAEVVQLYLDDPISSVVTPVMQLRGFQKISLRPGEKETVSFALTPEHLALLNRHLEWVVEPGEFKVMLGHASNDIRLTGTFEIAD